MIHADASGPLVGLFRPLPDREILVPGERVWYRQPKHWIAMVEPTAESAAVLLLLTPLWFGLPGALSMVQSLGVIAAIYVVVRAVQRRDWGWGDAALAAMAAVVIVNARLGLGSITLLVALAAVARLVVHLVRWAFYEERFITDRRIIETTGLLGSRVSSMPLGRVTDISLDRSPLAEIAGYGELRVESAGQDQALGRIRHLREPERFHEMIVWLSTHEKS